MRLSRLALKGHDQLIDGIVDPVLVLDRDRAIVDLNLAAVRLAGAPEQWHGLRVERLFPFLDGVAVTGATAPPAFTIEAGTRTYDVRVSRVHVGDAAWLVTLGDVSESRRLAAEREAFVTRTSDMVATISRELRTPIAAIHGALELVLDGARSALVPGDERVLTGALRSCERLTRIVHDLLGLSTIESARPASGPRPFAPERLVIDALLDVEGLAEAKQIRIESTVGRDLPLALGAHDQIVEALVTIVSNAIAGGPAGSTVAVSAWLDRTSIVLAVRGAGPGLPPDHVTRALVEQYGGRVAVTPEPTGGATVCLYLPQAPHEGEAPADAGSRPAVAPPTRAARILVADDDPDLRDIVTEALQAKGFSVIGAEDGQQAVEILTREQVDLALLDLNMPHVQGDEVIRRLRSGERQPDLPVVMLTGSLDERQAPDRLGADVLLTKPADLRRLVAEIQTLLQRPGATSTRG